MIRVRADGGGGGEQKKGPRIWVYIKGSAAGFAVPVDHLP